MFTQKIKKNTLRIKSIVGILSAFLLCAVISAVALANSAPTPETQGEACRTTVAVGVSKAVKTDTNFVVNGLAKNLTDITQVKAIAIPSSNFPSEQDFRAQASRINPDFLLRLEVERGNNAVSATSGNIPCRIFLKINCVRTKTVYKIKYFLEEFDTRKILKSGVIERASSDENKALGEVTQDINSQIGNFFNRNTTEAGSIISLHRKHLCYSGFPRNPASLIMKYDVTTAGKKVAYDYFIKGNLWRVSIRPKGGTSPYIIGYNGSQIWTLNKTEGVSVFTPSKENSAVNRVNFLLGEFLTEADSENLKYEIVSSAMVGKEAINGKNCQIVESVSRADTFIRFYYDAQTGALLKKTILDENKKVESETIFDDYREVTQGSRFPFKIVSKTVQGEASIVFVDVSLNPEISNEIFLKP